MRKIGIIICVVAGVLFCAGSALFLPLVFISLLIAGIGVVFIVVPEDKLKSFFEKILCTFSSKKRQEVEERAKKIEEAARLKKEEETRAQKAAEEECAKNGHKWERIPYEPDFFIYKKELFDCLPLDGHIEEECSVCGATRESVIDDMRVISVPERLRSSITYNSKKVGTYELRLNPEESYCIRAKKDIPKMSIQKGQVFLVLSPKYEKYLDEDDLSKYYKYYDKEDISAQIEYYFSDAKIPEDFDEALEYLEDFPDDYHKTSEVFYDNGDMPGMVEFSRYVAFVDEESNEILSSASIDFVEVESTEFVHLKIGILEIPDHGLLRAFCAIKSESF